jgi:hypothetical protein
MQQAMKNVRFQNGGEHELGRENQQCTSKNKTVKTASYHALPFFLQPNCHEGNTLQFNTL